MAIKDLIGRVFRRSAGTDVPADKNVTVWPFRATGPDAVSSPELATRIATAYRCIDVMSKGVAQLSLELKRKHDDGHFEVDESDPLNYLFNVRPNDRLNAFDFRRNIVIQVLTQGNAYVIPDFGPDGYRSLCLLSPNCCYYDKIKNVYVVTDMVQGINGTYSADEVIHIKNMSLDGGFTGVSTIQYAASVLAISANADKQNIDTFKSGGLVRGFVSGEGGGVAGFGAYQDKQLDDVAGNVEKQISSGKNIFSLPGEMKFNQISLSPADIELLATKEFNVLEICRFFGVHPDKVFAQQSSNYKASEMSQVAFLTDTLQPILTQIEIEFQSKLIPFEACMKYKIDFNIEALLQTDLITQATYMEKTIATGARTVNEWRLKRGQAPVEGGDVPMVSANLVPVNSKKLWGEDGKGLPKTE